MITLDSLAQEIETEINTELVAHPIQAERGSYDAIIVADTADYQKATRNVNTVTYHIQGVLRQEDVSIENGDNGFINISISANLDLIVPVIEGSDENGNKEIVKTVREMLTNLFCENKQESITEGNTTYSVSRTGTIPMTGERMVLGKYGDCFMFSVQFTYFFAQAGLNSKEIELTIDGNAVGAISYGFSRQTTSEGTVPAGENGDTKNQPTSSTLVINFNFASAKNAITDIVNSYILGGGDEFRTVHLVHVKIPKTSGYIEKDYLMIFSESTLNAEQALNASNTAAMVEVHEMQSGMLYSTAAQAYVNSRS